MLDHYDQAGDDTKILWIVMELCDQGSVDKYFKKRLLDIGHKAAIMEQIASGLDYLHHHEPPVMHRDIKPGNVLIKAEVAEHVVKLADFGVSKVRDNMESSYLTFAGTRCYMAPEVIKHVNNPLRGAKYTKAVDFFAAGITFYQMVMSESGKWLDIKNLFPTEGFIGQVMWDRRYERWNPIVIRSNDPNTVKIIKEMISAMIVVVVPGKRLSMQEVVTKIQEIQPFLPSYHEIPPLKAEAGASANQAPTGSSGAMAGMKIKDRGLNPDLPPSVTKSPASSRGATAEDHFLPDFLLSDQPSCPTILSRKPFVKQLFFHKLSCGINEFIGFSNKGVFVEELGVDNLIKLEMSPHVTEAVPTYNIQWQKARPQEMERGCVKYIMDDGRIVMSHTSDYCTFVFDANLELISSFTGDFGRLCGIIAPDKLLYSKQVGDEYHLHIYSVTDHKHLHQLSQSVSSEKISVSTHASGWLAIMDTYGFTLDLYKSDWSHSRQERLGFHPRWMNGVCCVKDFIVVTRNYTSGMHIYNWEGDMMMELDVDGQIQGVGPGGQGRIQVQACVEDVDYLHVFAIE